MSNEPLLLNRIENLKQQLEESNKTFTSMSILIGSLVLMAGGYIEVPMEFQDSVPGKTLKTWIDSEKNCLILQVEDES
jgi:hypothetical protein